MTRRLLAGLLALTLIPVAVAGCERTVSVRAGERVVCRYGDTIKDTVKQVEVPANRAAEYRVTASTDICERHEKLLAIYLRAQKALAAGDMKAAAADLKQVVADDPAFEQASSQLTEINAGRRPAPHAPVGGSGDTSPSAPATSTGGSGNQPVGPTLTLVSWCPEMLAGYDTRSTSADALNLAREYIPQSGGPLDAVVISVEQYSSKKTAAAGLKAQMGAYPADRRTEKIAGRSSIFGTDGRQFAALGLSDGAIVVIVEGHAKSGTDPAKLHDSLKAVAAKLPQK